MISQESHEYISKLREGPAFGANGFDLAELRTGMATRSKPGIDGTEWSSCRIDQIPCEWVIAPGADPDVRLLYLHGGGYVSGAAAFYVAMAARLSKAAGCAVLLPDYRLAPEDPFPAGLEDCVKVHEWLRNNGPSGPKAARCTFVGGDSAGGGMTLAVMLALRDRNLPLPSGGICLSPYTDLTLSGDSIRSQGELDPIMHPKCLPDFVRYYIGDRDARDPYISPAFGNYAGFPPLLIQVGEHEIIRDDSVMSAEQARQAGVDVTLEIWPGMFHVFQSHDLPEAGEAIERIGQFIRKLVPEI